MAEIVSSSVFWLIAVFVVAVPGLAFAALARLVFLLLRGDGPTARRFLGAALLAGLPVILTAFSFLVAFLMLDPLWPAQDETLAMHLAYVAERDRADLVYRCLGLANIAACLWSASRLRQAWKTSRREAA